MDETSEQTQVLADPDELWSEFVQLRHDGPSGQWLLMGEDGQLASAPTLEAALTMLAEAGGAAISW